MYMLIGNKVNNCTYVIGLYVDVGVEFILTGITWFLNLGNMFIFTENKEFESIGFNGYRNAFYSSGL